MEELNQKLAEILDVDAVADGDVLADFPQWDSLSVLSVIAMLDSKFGVHMVAGDLKNIRTAADLWGFVQAKKQP